MIMNHCRIPIILIVAMFALPTTVAHAHFIWLVRQMDGEAGDRVELYFSEAAEPDDPDLLQRVKDVTIWQLGPDGHAQKFALQLEDDALFAGLGDKIDGHSLFVARHDYGVLERNGESFALRYYAKTGPKLGDEAWSRNDSGKHLALDVIPVAVTNGIRIEVRWQAKPLAGAQVIVSGPGMKDFEATSDKQGQATFETSKPGLFSIRVRHIENQAGERNGHKYESIRHYSTLALNVTTAGVSADSPADNHKAEQAAASTYPPLPELVTSFGAAVLNDALYVYGGHTGRAHEYWDDSQARTLRRLDLKNGKAWESLGTGPGLQGLAMVAHGGKLYRLGGFLAKNKEGEEHDLWSQADVACYDPTTKQWNEMSPLPEPRSSFDAAVLGDKVYVIGGWKLAGQDEPHWHTSAHELDLASESPQWKALPEPPFQRRALSVAAHDGKVYVLGGMQAEGGPTTRVDVFDPAGGTWSQGPHLQGEPMDGFGSSAFAAGGHLYVTTFSGKLQQLTEDGKSWEVIRQLERARFFHRMLPWSENRLIIVGGASMQSGKFEELDVIDVP